jgi:hypothetical protein
MANGHRLPVWGMVQCGGGSAARAGSGASLSLQGGGYTISTRLIGLVPHLQIFQARMRNA